MSRNLPTDDPELAATLMRATAALSDRVEKPLVNRVHPETGKAWERWQDQPVIKEVLREEERTLGLHEVTASRPREGKSQEPRSRVDRLIDMLKKYQQVLGLARERNATLLAVAAARTRPAWG